MTSTSGVYLKFTDENAKTLEAVEYVEEVTDASRFKKSEEIFLSDTAKFRHVCELSNHELQEINVFIGKVFTR